MARPRTDPSPRTLAQVTDSQDLRSVISAALSASPVDESSLRRGVWTLVGAERDAGTSPGHVIAALTDLVDAVRLDPAVNRQALMRRVILWCVEAYFGHLGGESSGGDAAAAADSVEPVSGR